LDALCPCVPGALFAASILGFRNGVRTAGVCRGLFRTAGAFYARRPAIYVRPGILVVAISKWWAYVMITKLRDSAACDPATLSALIGLLKRQARPGKCDRDAHGQVALMAINTDQTFATEKLTQIAQAGNSSALVVFSAVVGGDIKLTAAGPGVGIGGGGESLTQTSSGIGGFFAVPHLHLRLVRQTPR
jgi:hypothetical protein